MAGRQSAASEKAAAYLKQNPTITAQALAVKFGLSISSVLRSQYWRQRVRPTSEATK